MTGKGKPLGGAGLEAVGEEFNLGHVEVPFRYASRDVIDRYIDRHIDSLELQGEVRGRNRNLKFLANTGTYIVMRLDESTSGT